MHLLTRLRYPLDDRSHPRVARAVVACGVMVMALALGARAILPPRIAVTVAYLNGRSVDPWGRGWGARGVSFFAYDLLTPQELAVATFPHDVRPTAVLPYSIGPNGTDERGTGDDITPQPEPTSQGIAAALVIASILTLWSVSLGVWMVIEPRVQRARNSLWMLVCAFVGLATWQMSVEFPTPWPLFVPSRWQLTALGTCLLLLTPRPLVIARPAGPGLGPSS